MRANGTGGSSYVCSVCVRTSSAGGGTWHVCAVIIYKQLLCYAIEYNIMLHDFFFNKREFFTCANDVQLFNKLTLCRVFQYINALAHSSKCQFYELFVVLIRSEKLH